MASPSSSGVQTLTRKKLGAKVNRGKSWIWDRLKTDPTFPKPIYLSPGAPVWVESEVDAWLMALAERSRKS